MQSTLRRAPDASSAVGAVACAAPRAAIVDTGASGRRRFRRQRLARLNQFPERAQTQPEVADERMV